MESIREAIWWMGRHWLHFVIAPAMLIGFTVFHEAAHAALVVVQGGEILEFSVLPKAGEWGHVSYQFPNGLAHSQIAISLAPYVMWLTSMASVGLMSFRRGGWPLWIASTAFLWGFVGAGGDIANAWLGWTTDRNGHNDLASAFGAAGFLEGVVLVVSVLAATVAGFVIQRRLYRKPLSLPAYCLLVAVLTALCALLALFV